MLTDWHLRDIPFHIQIMPGMVTDEDRDLVMAFGVMGGFMQPQGHVQVRCPVSFGCRRRAVWAHACCRQDMLPAGAAPQVRSGGCAAREQLAPRCVPTAGAVTHD